MSEYQIDKSELRDIIFFACQRYITDGLHMSGTSQRRDLIGGYIDRWINNIATTTVFNGLLREHNLSVVSDYFLYDNSSTKNAPDILGTIDINNNIKAYTHYNDDRWEPNDNAPQIEVKAVKAGNYMCALKSTQFDPDHYYCFAEVELHDLYLISCFERDFFSDDRYKMMQMNEMLVKSNNNGLLNEPKEDIHEVDNLGMVRLLSIIKGSELEKEFLLLGEGEDVYYFKRIILVERVTNSTSKRKRITNGKYIYSYSGNKYLPVYLMSSGNIWLKKSNTQSFYIESESDFTFNTTNYTSGLYKIEFGKLKRSSSWREYMCNAPSIGLSINELYSDSVLDATNELVNKMVRFSDY